MISATFGGVFSLIIRKQKGTEVPLRMFIQLLYQPTAGAVRATGVDSAAARSRGKL